MFRQTIKALLAWETVLCLVLIAGVLGVSECAFAVFSINETQPSKLKENFNATFSCSYRKAILVNPENWKIRAEQASNSSDLNSILSEIKLPEISMGLVSLFEQGNSVKVSVEIEEANLTDEVLSEKVVIVSIEGRDEVSGDTYYSLRIQVLRNMGESEYCGLGSGLSRDSSSRPGQSGHCSGSQENNTRSLTYFNLTDSKRKTIQVDDELNHCVAGVVHSGHVVSFYDVRKDNLVSLFSAITYKSRRDTINSNFWESYRVLSFSDSYPRVIVSTRENLCDSVQDQISDPSCLSNRESTGYFYRFGRYFTTNQQ